jgi:hypothetical protein
MTAIPQRPLERTGECRRCGSFCDKVIDPGQCLAARCPSLYAYDDELSGARYVGCLQKVFRAEVRLDAISTEHRARRFGGVRATGRPLPHCPTSIERAFEGHGAWYRCVNPEFWAADDSEAEFDLRDVC